MNSNGQLISFPIDANLDESANTSVAPPGTLAELLNLERLSEAGGLTKRHGYRAVDDTDWLNEQDVAVRLFEYGGAILRVDQDSVWAYAHEAARATLRDRAPTWRLTGRRHIAGDGTTAAKYAGCAINGAFRCWVWQQQSSGGTEEVWSVTLDHATGSVLRGPERLSTAGTDAELPRVIAITSGIPVFIVHWIEDATNVIKGRELGASAGAVQTGTWTSAVTVVNNVASMASRRPSYDITVTGATASQRYVIAYVCDDGAEKIRAARCADTATVVSTYEVAYTNGLSVSVAGMLDEDNVWLAYINDLGATATLRVLDSSMTSLASAGVLIADLTTLAVSMEHSTRVVLTGTFADPGQTRRTLWNAYTYSAGSISTVAAADHALYRAVLASKPFYSGRDWFAWMEVGVESVTAREAPYVSTVLVGLTHDGGSLYTSAPGTAPPQLVVATGRTVFGQWADTGVYQDSGGTNPHYCPQAAAEDEDGNFYSAAHVRPRPPFDGGFYAGLVSSDAAEAQEYVISPTAGVASPAHVAAAAGRVVVCSGGCQPMQYDGQQFTEIGFVDVPWYRSVSSSSSGGTIDAGTYQYAFTYEYIDTTGQRQQSAPIIANTTTTLASGSTNSVTWTISTALAQVKQDPEHAGTRVTVVLWRTKAGPDGIYRRVASAINDTSSATISITDTSSDDDIGGNEPLYISTGELENLIPPPSRHVVPFGNRLAGIDAEFPERIWFSKRLRFDESWSYSPALEQYIPGIGELTALAELDGTLYAFSETGIAVAAYGEGPDNTGGGTWPAPQVICRGVGCIDARAVTTCPDGVLFASGTDGRTRIWLLPRGGGTPVEVGAKVRKTLDTYGIVASMSHAAALGRVYVTVTRLSGTSYVLVYDYSNRGADGMGSWFVWSLTNSTRSAVFAEGTHWVAGSTVAMLLRQDETSYADKATTGGGDAWVTWSLRTHDIRAGSFAPFGKINTITGTFEYQDQARVYIDVSTDQGSTTTRSWSDVTSGTAGAQLVRQVQPALKRFYSGVGFSIEMSDADPASVADSASVLPRGLTIDYLPLHGTVRPQSTERMSG